MKNTIVAIIAGLIVTSASYANETAPAATPAEHHDTATSSKTVTETKSKDAKGHKHSVKTEKKSEEKHAE